MQILVGLPFMKTVKCPHCKAKFKYSHVCRKLKNHPCITRDYVDNYSPMIAQMAWNAWARSKGF